MQPVYVILLQRHTGHCAGHCCAVAISKPMQDVARLLRKHEENILTYFDMPISNGIVEEPNNKAKGISHRALEERFGLSDAALTQASRRIRLASKEDESLGKLMKEVAGKLKM